MKNCVGSKTRIFGFLLGIYLALLFCVVIPFHHHADNESHDDCSICVIAQLGYISDVVLPLQALLVVFLASVLVVIKVKYTPQNTLHLRSPPVPL